MYSSEQHSESMRAHGDRSREGVHMGLSDLKNSNRTHRYVDSHANFSQSERREKEKEDVMHCARLFVLNESSVFLSSSVYVLAYI